MTRQGVSKDSCQVTVGDVTVIDVSITGSRNFNGDLTFGTLSRSFFSCRLGATSITVVRMCYLKYSLDMHCMRGESGKDTFFVTLRSWIRWTHQKSMLGDSMQRKSSCRKW